MFGKESGKVGRYGMRIGGGGKRGCGEWGMVRYCRGAGRMGLRIGLRCFSSCSSAEEDVRYLPYDCEQRIHYKTGDTSLSIFFLSSVSDRRVSTTESDI